MRAVIRTLEDLDNFAARAAQSGVITGQALEVTLKPYKRKRSLDQNAKLHVLIHELARHISESGPQEFSASELKDYIKAEYGKHRTVTIAGKPRLVPMSTTEYNVEELGELIERVYQLGAEAGCEFQESKDD